MITVSIENDDQNDLFVSVIDLNRAGSPVIVDNTRINSGESILVDIQDDSHGAGNICWKAQRTDSPSKAAQRTVAPSAGDTVEVTTQFG